MKIPALLVATMKALAASLALNSVSHAEIDRPECIAPAKPGGGFDLTCKLAQQGLQDLLPGPMRVTYMPGGIGAVAYNTIIAQRPDDLVVGIDLRTAEKFGVDRQARTSDRITKAKVPELIERPALSANESPAAMLAR